MYVHVDDIVTMKGCDSPPSVDTLMHSIADVADQLGLSTPGGQGFGDVTKVLGYEPVHRPARLQLTSQRLGMLCEALLFTVSRAWVDVRLLHCLSSIWIWAALLNRSLLAVPHSF